jgi:hypothetical protein
MSALPEELAVVERQAVEIAAKIPLIAITDQTSFELATEDRREIKRRLARIAALMDGMCEDTHRAWKTAVAKREWLRAPFVDADKAYARAQGAYEAEQTRIRQEAERAAQRERERLEAEERQRVAAEEARLRREAEDRRLALAVEAEQRGDTDTATRLVNAPADVVVVPARPVFVPVAPTAPKPAAPGVSFRDNYSAEVTDLIALVQSVATGAQPITLLLPNMPALNQMARALKDAMSIPGVKAKNERIAAQRA